MARTGDRELRQRAAMLWASEAALVVRLGDSIAPAIHGLVLAVLRALDATPPPGMVEVVPAYASLLIHFDPALATPMSIAGAVRDAVKSLGAASIHEGRQVRIPVHYGGTDGPDLEDVARLVGLAPDEVVRRHAAAEYRVYFLGFLAGFPYLGGLPPELAVPRLAAPRTSVPAGSVGLAGNQTGVYSVTSPGGWRLIGRTSARLFDPTADPPALLRPGDRVSFVPVAEAEPESGVVAPVTVEAVAADAGERDAAASPGAPLTPQPPPSAPPPTDALPWLRVLRPGPLTTVQDLGRHGYGRYGVCAAGAVDRDALLLGNLLLGNPSGAAALEVTLGGAAFEAQASCAVVLTGARCESRVGSRPLRSGEVAALTPGDVVELGVMRRGARAYLCVAGGVAVPLVLGSRSTDARAGLGGVAGRALRSGDMLMRGTSAPAPGALVGRRPPGAALDHGLDHGQRVTLRILPGPHAFAARGSVQALAGAGWVVDPRSDRVGVRLQPDGPASALVGAGGEMLSEGVPHGAIQLPPNGEPIILLANHQATGGYRIPAVVIQADLWRAAQLRPGDHVRLAPVTLKEALAALRARQERLRRLAHALSGPPDDPGTHEGNLGGALDSALLMRGFAEWSEEEDDDVI